MKKKKLLKNKKVLVLSLYFIVEQVHVSSTHQKTAGRQVCGKQAIAVMRTIAKKRKR